jgi:hypothetical protein
MTIKAYRRKNMERTPKLQRPPQPRRSGSFWGISWQADDFDDGDWDATPGSPRDTSRS